MDKQSQKMTFISFFILNLPLIGIFFAINNFFFLVFLIVDFFLKYDMGHFFNSLPLFI